MKLFENLHKIARHPQMIAEIKACEGFEAKPYRDHLGYLTIGHGTLIEKGISKKTAEIMMIVQHSEMLKEFEILSGLELTDEDSIPAPVAMSLANMVYQMGAEGVCKFKKMLSAIERQDWEAAAREGLDSKWAGQTPGRAEEMMRRVRECG